MVSKTLEMVLTIPYNPFITEICKRELKKENLRKDTYKDVLTEWWFNKHNYVANSQTHSRLWQVSKK